MKTNPDYSRSRAVLIGTGDYSHLTAVPAAMNSLARMKAALTSDLCGWPDGQITVFGNEQKPGDLPDRLTQLYQDVDQVALFYYVGHGQVAPTPTGDTLCLSMVGSRTEPARRKSTSLAFEDVAYALWHSPAETKIVILDCCYAGLAGRLGRTEILDLTRAAGAYTLAASGEFSIAWHEMDSETSTPQTYFTKYLLDVVENGIPDAGPELRLESIFRRAATNLVRDGKPQPTSGAIQHAPRFVFASNIAHTPGPTLTISQAVYDEIVARARAGYPLIVCGFGVGPFDSDSVEYIAPMTNAKNSPTEWEFDPYEQIAAWRKMDRQDEEPILTYHSRPDSDAYLSRIDIEFGNSNNIDHFVIVSVDGRGHVDFRSHRITDTRVWEENVRVIPANEF